MRWWWIRRGVVCFWVWFSPFPSCLPFKLYLKQRILIKNTAGFVVLNARSTTINRHSTQKQDTAPNSTTSSPLVSSHLLVSIITRHHQWLLEAAAVGSSALCSSCANGCNEEGLTARTPPPPPPPTMPMGAGGPPAPLGEAPPDAAPAAGAYTGFRGALLPSPKPQVMYTTSAMTVTSTTTCHTQAASAPPSTPPSSASVGSITDAPCVWVILAVACLLENMASLRERRVLEVVSVLPCPKCANKNSYTCVFGVGIYVQHERWLHHIDVRACNLCVSHASPPHIQPHTHNHIQPLRRTTNTTAHTTPIITTQQHIRCHGPTWQQRV